MCASYGLQIPPGEFETLFQFNERTPPADVREWLETNGGETVRPTGRIAKNLAPIVRAPEADPVAELGWWGYLIGGVPSKFPSIDTRSERLQNRPGGLKNRALAPATKWFEYQKPSKQKWSFTVGDGELFAIAAVTQTGQPVDGAPVTCYSLVMQPAREDLWSIHDRMPLLLPQAYFEEWLDPAAEPSRELIEAALDAGGQMTAQVTAREV